MSAEQLFQLLGPVAMIGWIALIVFPGKVWANTIVPFAIAAVLALVYAALVITSLPGSDGSFSSLEGVRKLFEDPWALLAGWTHYLAFDLFIGSWEVRDAQRRGVPHLLVIPALVMTFLLGPAGLLLYLAIRRFAAKRQATTLE